MRIEFKTNISLDKDACDDGDSLLTLIEGDICADTFDEDEPGKKVIGKIRAVLFACERADESGVSLVDASDAIDDELTSVATEFYSDTERRDEELMEDWSFLGPNVLYIRWIEIDKKYRGRGIGLAAIRRTIDVFAVRCGRVVLEPVPLQFRTKEHRGTAKYKAAAKKLQTYYRTMGFKSRRGTSYMVLDLAYRAKDVLLDTVIEDEDEA